VFSSQQNEWFPLIKLYFSEKREEQRRKEGRKERRRMSMDCESIVKEQGGSDISSIY
jgi:hypothetical protein